MAYDKTIFTSASTIILLWPIILLSIVHLTSSSETSIKVPGEIAFTVTLGDGSVQEVRDWLKNGGNNRIKIHVNYASDFGFPPEADCPDSDAQDLIAVAANGTAVMSEDDWRNKSAKIITDMDI